MKDLNKHNNVKNVIKRVTGLTNARTSKSTIAAHHAHYNLKTHHFVNILKSYLQNPNQSRKEFVKHSRKEASVQGTFCTNVNINNSDVTEVQVVILRLPLVQVAAAPTGIFVFLTVLII